MFSGSQIGELVGLLEARKVPVYHACQYQDFVSYLRLGGIPSRDRLEYADLDNTPFTTDQADRENDVWDKVFVNLEDFGRTFARGHAAVPIPYGPLLLRLHPSALFEADDVAICLRSAGAQKFDRRTESLKTIAEVDRLFWKPLSEGRALALLKFKDGLRREFGSKANAVEVSCTCKSGLLSFTKLFDVVVDPYRIEGVPLAEWAQRAVVNSDLKVPVRVRKTSVDASVYDEIASLVTQRTPTLAEFPSLTTRNSLASWAERIRTSGLEYQYARFADYLRIGTLDPLAELARTADRDDYEATLPLLDYSYEVDEDLYEEETLYLQEIYEDAEAWSRSEDEGWYYPD